MPIVLTQTEADVFWTSRQEVERVYGPTNVARWADVENTANEAFIAEQIEAAVEDATDDARSRLRGGACGPVFVAPKTLRRMTSRLAGGLLYESRGVKDTSDEEGRNRLSTSLKMADKWFRRVFAGQVRIFDGDVGVTTHPIVVSATSPYQNPYGPWLTSEQMMYLNFINESRGVPNYIWWSDGVFDMPFQL